MRLCEAGRGAGGQEAARSPVRRAGGSPGAADCGPHGLEVQLRAWSREFSALDRALRQYSRGAGRRSPKQHGAAEPAPRPQCGRSGGVGRRGGRDDPARRDGPEAVGGCGCPNGPPYNGGCTVTGHSTIERGHRVGRRARTFAATAAFVVGGAGYAATEALEYSVRYVPPGGAGTHPRSPRPGPGAGSAVRAEGEPEPDPDSVSDPDPASEPGSER